MGLRDACCSAFHQGHRSNKAGEQKHVTICHMPPGHKLSSRYTLGCVRPGGSVPAASLVQVPSCPMPFPWDQPLECPNSVVWEDLTCDPSIWRDGCIKKGVPCFASVRQSTGPSVGETVHAHSLRLQFCVREFCCHLR